jgi:hypothetical protein
MHNPGNELRRGMYATITLQVPAVQLNRLAGDAGEDQRRAYEQGLVLAVPERAVIDTGYRKIIYRESEPDTFDGVEVQLGPRCGAFYPVLRGLQAGDRVAAAGSFLIDAETRLTAGASSTYFGSSGGPHGTDRHSAAIARPSMMRDEADKVQAVLAKLTPQDRQMVEAQGYCPVLPDNRLGSMGQPVKVLVKAQPVFLCCTTCVNKALSDGSKTLAKAEEARERVKAGPSLADSAAPTSAGAGAKDAKAKASLAKLGPEDRRQAEAQGSCPQSGQPLGAMGVPVKITLKGEAVFLCCEGCVEDARADADRTLANVAKLKAKTKSGWPGK